MQVFQELCKQLNINPEKFLKKNKLAGLKKAN
jgi:hypothetical protein